MANEIKTINDIFLCDVTARADIAKIVENYASKIYVDDKLSNLNLNTNLDNYATKTYVKQLITNSEAKINVSLNNYATKTYVDQEINKAQLDSGETPIDLSNYVSKSELEEANYVSYNEFESLQEEINTLKQIVEDLKNNSTTPPEEPEEPEQPEPPEEPKIIYGNIIISTSSLTINEGNTSNFTVKLDKAPTQQQIVNISVNNNNIRIDKTSLVFDSNNYNVAQTISVLTTHLDEDYTNKTANITISSNNVSDKLVKISIINIDTEPIDPEPEPPIIDTLTLNPTSITFTEKHASKVITATLTGNLVGSTVTWKSSNATVASVTNGGKVTALAKGNCTITATCGSKSATCSVTVNISVEEPEEPSTETIPCTALSIDQNIITFTSKEEKIQLNAIKTPANCNEPVTWSSVNSSIAEVTNTGLVTPIKNGVTTINVVCGTKVASCGVQVDFPPDPVTLPTIDIVYDNPTLTIVDNKLKAEQNGIVQYFDVSYERNKMHPHYADCEMLRDPNNNEYYYMALTSRGLSPFGKNGNHIDSGGWYDLKDSNGGIYVLCASILAINNFNGNVKVRNVNVEDSLVNESLRLFNQGFPMLNFTVDNSSLNTIEYNANDPHFVESETALAFEVTYEDHFKIVLHPDRIKAEYGTYNINNKSWIHVLIHELGHTLGASDNAKHHPTLMAYDENRERCLYLQPNDIAFIKYLHQTKYGVDIPTIQEETNPYKTNGASIDLNNIDFEAIKENIKNDPTIGLVHYYNQNTK